MLDAFHILRLPRAAALDAGLLGQSYAERSRAEHPDHGGSEGRAAEINEAFEILRAPERRLKHLLELAAPAEAKGWRSVPLDDAMMSLFSALGGELEASARLLERRDRARSAIARAVLAGEETRRREALERLGFEIARRIAELEEQLPGLDAALAAGDGSIWPRLAAIQARFAYLAKWQAQVRERLLALM